MCIRHHIVILLGIVCFWQCCELCAGKGLKGRYTTENPLVFEDAWEKWPYSFVNSKGVADGFDIELTREVMRRLGLPFVVRLNDQDSVYHDMERGGVNLTFATKIAPYAKYGSFGNVTITQAETSLMVPRKDSVAAVTVNDLCLRRILVREGSLSHHALMDNGMPDSLISAQEHMAMAILDMVADGEGGALWNTVMLKWLIRKYGIRDYVLVPTDIPSAEYRYMSNDRELLHAIDSVCLVMQQEGRIDAMKNRWMYPEEDSGNYLYVYILLALTGVVVLLAAVVVLMRYYHTYYSHSTLDDINAQMELILSSNDMRVWVYDVVEDTYAWMLPDGRVEKEYSVFEFSRFYGEKDFQLIHSMVKKLKRRKGKIITRHLQQTDVSMQAIADDYGRVYMVYGVERNLTTSQPHNPTTSQPHNPTTPQPHNLKQLRALAEEILREAGRTLRVLIIASVCSIFSVQCLMAQVPSSARLSTAGVQKTTPLGIRYTKKHPLIIVCDWNFAPYSFRNDKLQQDGFLVELVEQIFNQIHVPYEIKMVEWKKAKRMLYAGEAQLMIDINKPDDLFGAKYGRSVLADYPLCVARLKNVPAMRSIETLNGNDTLYVNYGDYALHYIVTKNVKPIVLSCPPYDALSEILSGRIKYYVWSKVALRKMIRDFNMQDKIAIDDVDVLRGKFQFMSNDAQLLDEIDTQFERLQTLGRYKPLVDKWLSEEGVYEEGATATDVIAIVAMLLLFVGSIIALVFIMRGGNTGNLKREFKAVAHMAIGLTGCNVLAINVRRMWVYNVSGDFLPRKGLSMADYEALIHPDDIMTEYEARQRVDDGERNMPMVSFRMRKHDGAPDEWHNVKVYAYVKSKKEKRPAYVYLALKVENGEQKPLTSNLTTSQPHNLQPSIIEKLEALVKEIDSLPGNMSEEEDKS